MKNLSKLNVTLEQLYDAQNKQINVHLSDKSYVFVVVLKGRDNKPDCNISSFGANLYFRTQKGQNSLKYATLSSLQSAIVRSVNKYVNTNGKISFSISDEVHFM